MRKTIEMLGSGVSAEISRLATTAVATAAVDQTIDFQGYEITFATRDGARTAHHHSFGAFHSWPYVRANYGRREGAVSNLPVRLPQEKPDNGGASRANLRTAMAGPTLEIRSLRPSFSKPQDFVDLVRNS